MDPWYMTRENVEKIDLPSTSNNLTSVTLRQSCPRLVQVEYPGLVENPEKAVRTLGGIYKVSQVLGTPKKKLELRFRPADVYCKPAYGESSVTCGLLIKIRRRKSTIKKEAPESSEPEHQGLTDLANLPQPPKKEKDPAPSKIQRKTPEEPLLPNCEIVQFGGGEMMIFNGPIPASIQARFAPRPQPEVVNKEPEKNVFTGASAALLTEEEKLLEAFTLKDKFEDLIDDGDESFLAHQVGRGRNMDRLFIKVPENLPSVEIPQSDLDVKVLGIIPRCYKFNGLCDFQYLPMKKVPNKKRHVSLINRIVPTFPNPDAPNVTVDDLIVCDVGREGHGSNIPSFLVPPIMSRVDKPLENIVKYLEASLAKDLRRPPSDRRTISSTRAKRIVYSNLCNFRITDGRVHTTTESQLLVPRLPYPEASRDAGKRGLLGAKLEIVKAIFERRPIWTKTSVAYESNLCLFDLKYILPCVAYFGNNGPWRSCWIRFGYDPRKDRFAYIYQLLDYRVPLPYRAVMDRKKKVATKADREALFIFTPNMIPPKCQMIYQLHDIRIKEVDELKKVLEDRMVRNERVRFEPRFGFLTEDIIEYCRYCISRNIELFLFDTGRIRSVTLPEIILPADGEIPREITQKPSGTSKVSQTHTRRGPGEKRRVRTRARPFPYEVGDEASNQSSVIGDLKIYGEMYEEVGGDGTEEDETDEDQRIMNEALEAASGGMDEDVDGGGSDDYDDDDEEMDIDSIDPDQILGLE